MRIEHDLLGEKSIPDDAYYGVQTARAMENFHISGVPLSQYPDLIRALAIVKRIPAAYKRCTAAGAPGVNCFFSSSSVPSTSEITSSTRSFAAFITGNYRPAATVASYGGRIGSGSQHCEALRCPPNSWETAEAEAGSMPQQSV